MRNVFQRANVLNCNDSMIHCSTGFRTLVAGVKEGREEDVMTYLAMADRTSPQDWQKTLDQSVAIAIKEKQARIMKLLAGAGVNLDQGDNGIPLLFEAFRSADPDILDTFLENYKGDIASQLQSAECELHVR